MPIFTCKEYIITRAQIITNKHCIAKLGSYRCPKLTIRYAAPIGIGFNYYLIPLAHIRYSIYFYFVVGCIHVLNFQLRLCIPLPRMSSLWLA